MSGVSSSIKIHHHRENEYRRQQSNLKRLKTKHEKILSRDTETKDRQVQEMNKKYSREVTDLESSLETKLITMRKKSKEFIGKEKIRLESELEQLRGAHQDKVNQLEESQNNQIQQMIDSHEEVISNAENKFIKERAKYES